MILVAAACGWSAHKKPTPIAATPTLSASVENQPGVNNPSGELKIGVTVEGLYEISGEDIVKIMPGWVNIAPARFRLTLRGQPEPVWVKTLGNTFNLMFYGKPNDSRYTIENTYLLMVDGGEPLPMEEKQIPGGGASPVDWFLATTHFEENKIYAPQVKDGDHFFWFSLPGSKKQDVQVELPKLTEGSGHLRVSVWGSTESPSEFDHHLVISLNDQVLIDEKWDGAGRRILDADIPAGVLKEKNILLLTAPGDTGAAAEINYLDWIEIQYPKKAEADNDFLAFGISSATAENSLQLSKFSRPILVVDVTVPTQTVRLSESDNQNALVFAGEVGHHYLAVGPNGFTKPASLSPVVLSPDLRAAGSGADYVVIGPQNLLQPLAPLLDWRTSQGLKVIAIPLEAVYDQFNGGIPEPQAIRALMIEAEKSWKPAPRYLLLVGDATYDPRGDISSAEANRLPVIFVQTDFGGETASDALLADVNGDQRPDLAVGRIPAQNTDQVRIYVQKVLAYEQSTDQEDWRNRVLAIADGQDIGFKSDAQSFLDQLSAPYTGTLYAPEAGIKDAQAKVISYFNEGYGLIAYFGHGSINMWGQDKIFMAEDVSNLANSERLPVVINMTCLTGFFIHPKVSSLTETLLWDENGGAVAMLAPTSLTLSSSQSFLSQALIDTWMQNPGSTLGDIYFQAQQKVPLNDPGAQEVLLTFLLFGDPALKISGQ